MHDLGWNLPTQQLQNFSGCFAIEKERTNKKIRKHQSLKEYGNEGNH